MPVANPWGFSSALDYAREDEIVNDPSYYTVPTQVYNSPSYAINPISPKAVAGTLQTAMNSAQTSDRQRAASVLSDAMRSSQVDDIVSRATLRQAGPSQQAPGIAPGGYGAAQSMGGGGGGGGGYQQLAQMMAQAMGGQQQPAAEKPPERKKTFDELNPNGTPSGANYKDARDPMTFTGGGYPAQDTQHGQGVIRDMLRNPQPSPYGAPPKGNLPGTKAPAAPKEDEDDKPSSGKKPAKKGSAWPTVRGRGALGGGRSFGGGFGGRFGR